MGVSLGPKRRTLTSSLPQRPTSSLASFCVENISATVCAKSREQRALESATQLVPCSMTAWQRFWAVDGQAGSNPKVRLADNPPWNAVAKTCSVPGPGQLITTMSYTSSSGRTNSTLAPRTDKTSIAFAPPSGERALIRLLSICLSTPSRFTLTRTFLRGVL